MRVNDVLAPLAIVITKFSIRLDVLLGNKYEDWFAVDVNELALNVAVFRVVEESPVTTVLCCPVNTAS